MALQLVEIGGVCETFKRTASGGLVPHVSYGTKAMTFREDKSGNRTAKGPDGWRRPLSYSMTTSTMRRPEGSAEYRAYGVTVLVTGPCANIDFSAPAPSFPSGLKQQAEVDALTKLKGQGVNLAQAFAERDQLANLVGNTASRIAKAYRATRKGNLKQAARELGASWKKSTSNWLELQYAWKPLLQDVHGSVEELQGKPPLDWLVTVTGKKSQKVRSVSETYQDAWIGFRRTDSIFHGAFVRLDYHPSNEFMSTVSRLGLTNPATLAWELLPYSFVVDWFLPIGDWLNVLDATAGFTFKGGSCSQLTKVNRVSDPTTRMAGGSKCYYNDYRGARGKFARLTRTVYGSSPLPRPPGLKNPASLGHMANGLSLLAEAFGKRR